jgi:hypothetical protein
VHSKAASAMRVIIFMRILLLPGDGRNVRTMKPAEYYYPV